MQIGAGDCFSGLPPQRNPYLQTKQQGAFTNLNEDDHDFRKQNACLLLATHAAGTALPAAAQENRIATVVKIAGIQWFNRMEEGVKKYAADTGTDAFQVGPAQADPQQQAALLEDMIAQGVKAIAVVPMSPEALEPVLARAQAAGIAVVSHEAASLQNVSYDIEAFQNEDFGANLMKNLGECMGGTGEYAVFVGSLTSQTHKQWVDGAIAYQTANFPDIVLVGAKNETFDDQQQAYAKAQEVLRAYPNVKGMQGSASTDAAGIGLAVEERGLEDGTCVVGTSLPTLTDGRSRWLRASPKMRPTQSVSKRLTLSRCETTCRNCSKTIGASARTTRRRYRMWSM